MQVKQGDTPERVYIGFRLVYPTDFTVLKIKIEINATSLFKIENK